MVIVKLSTVYYFQVKMAGPDMELRKAFTELQAKMVDSKQVVKIT